MRPYRVIFYNLVVLNLSLVNAVIKYQTCGLVSSAKPLISKGKVTNETKYPWHVGLYEENGNSTDQICGGTVLGPKAILTAAHCLFDGFQSSVKPPNRFWVAASKFSRSWSIHDGAEQRIPVQRIVTTGRYHDSATFYDHDIAVLELASPIQFSGDVMPACLDWNMSISLHNGDRGVVIGWGRDETGNLSAVLKSSEMPYLTYDSCQKSTPDSFQRFITSDKFCALYENGAGVQSGDSGGGFAFEKKGIYYLIGIVSIKPKYGADTIAAFTDVTLHIKWLKEVLHGIHSQACSEIVGSRCIHLEDCPTATSVLGVQLCSFDIEDPIVCCMPNGILYINDGITGNSSLDSIHAVSNTTSKSVSMCTRYAASVYGMDNATVSYKDTDSLEDDSCVRPNASFTVAVAGENEFPHMALIGTNESNKPIDWLCVGSLISERFVISAASHVVTRQSGRIAAWVRLGENLRFNKDWADPDDIPISAIFIHPHYNDMYYNDVALVKLGKDVEFSRTIVPICLQTSFQVQTDNAIITGFKGFDSHRPTATMKLSVNLLNQTTCDATFASYFSYLFLFPDGIVDSKQICAEGSKGLPIDQGFSGGSLQIRSNLNCMYSLVGIVSLNSKRDGYPLVSTRISHYIPWIEQIVWPDDHRIPTSQNALQERSTSQNS